MVFHPSSVALYKCPSYDYALVKQAVIKIGENLLNGWDSFIPKGSTVLLKPNLVMQGNAAKAVTTHPAVVKAVAEVCRDAGAGKIMIGDAPALVSARKVAEKCGMLEVAEELGIEIVEFTENMSVQTPENFLHRHFTIAREAVNADIIINIPKFKTHGMMGLTLAVKNLFGLFIGKQKVMWHFQCGRDHHNFARLLIELAYTVKPALSILDAVVGMEGNGPGSGVPRTLGFLAASRDMISLDRVAAEIVNIDPEKIPVLHAGNRLGFNTDLDHISIIGDAIGDLKIRDLKTAWDMNIEGPLFARPLSWLLGRYMTTKPYVDMAACKGCGICLKACPAQCITLAGAGKPVTIKHSDCIRCFCCQELCPEGAVTVKDAVGVKVIAALGRYFSR